MSAAPPARPRRSPSTKKQFFVGHSESVRRRCRARRRAGRCHATLINANQQSPATSAAATHPNSFSRFFSLPRRRTRRLPNSSGALLAKTTQSTGCALQHITIADAPVAPPQSSSSLDFSRPHVPFCAQKTFFGAARRSIGIGAPESNAGVIDVRVSLDMRHLGGRAFFALERLSVERFFGARDGEQSVARRPPNSVWETPTWAAFQIKSKLRNRKFSALTLPTLSVLSSFFSLSPAYADPLQRCYC